MQNPKEKYIYKYGEKGLGKFQVLEMAEYPDGTLYLGTYGTGLYKFNSKENCFEQCTVSNIHYCYNLSVTPHGYLAISNGKGLAHLSSRDPGNEDDRCREPIAFISNQRRMRFIGLP